jgi:hypothetical protein
LCIYCLLPDHSRSGWSLWRRLDPASSCDGNPGIGRLHRDHHGEMDIRRGSSARSDGDCHDVVGSGERHVRHLLGSYQRYYNDARLTYR